MILPCWDGIYKLESKQQFGLEDENFRKYHARRKTIHNKQVTTLGTFGWCNRSSLKSRSTFMVYLPKKVNMSTSFKSLQLHFLKLYIFRILIRNLEPEPCNEHLESKREDANINFIIHCFEFCFVCLQVIHMWSTAEWCLTVVASQNTWVASGKIFWGITIQYIFIVELL